jgi:hypothetical protein
MELIPIIVALAIALVGIGLMIAAFVAVVLRGSWQQAMQPDATGRWSLARKLMAAGAALGCVFAGLMFIPGVVPWWDYSWGHGVGFGFILGMAFYLLLFMKGQRSRTGCLQRNDHR